MTKSIYKSTHRYPKGLAQEAYYLISITPYEDGSVSIHELYNDFMIYAMIMIYSNYNATRTKYWIKNGYYLSVMLEVPWWEFDDVSGDSYTKRMEYFRRLGLLLHTRSHLIGGFYRSYCLNDKYDNVPLEQITLSNLNDKQIKCLNSKDKFNKAPVNNTPIRDNNYEEIQLKKNMPDDIRLKYEKDVYNIENIKTEGLHQREISSGYYTVITECSKIVRGYIVTKDGKGFTEWDIQTASPNFLLELAEKHLDINKNKAYRGEKRRLLKALSRGVYEVVGGHLKHKKGTPDETPYTRDEKKKYLNQYLNSPDPRSGHMFEKLFPIIAKALLLFKSFIGDDKEINRTFTEEKRHTRYYHYIKRFETELIGKTNEIIGKEYIKVVTYLVNDSIGVSGIRPTKIRKCFKKALIELQFTNSKLKLKDKTFELKLSLDNTSVDNFESEPFLIIHQESTEINNNKSIESVGSGSLVYSSTNIPKSAEFDQNRHFDQITKSHFDARNNVPKRKKYDLDECDFVSSKSTENIQEPREVILDFSIDEEETKVIEKLEDNEPDYFDDEYYKAERTIFNEENIKLNNYEDTEFVERVLQLSVGTTLEEIISDIELTYLERAPGWHGDRSSSDIDETEETL